MSLLSINKFFSSKLYRSDDFFYILYSQYYLSGIYCNYDLKMFNLKYCKKTIGFKVEKLPFSHYVIGHLYVKKRIRYTLNKINEFNM